MYLGILLCSGAAGLDRCYTDSGYTDCCWNALDFISYEEAISVRWVAAARFRLEPAERPHLTVSVVV